MTTYEALVDATLAAGHDAGGRAAAEVDHARRRRRRRRHRGHRRSAHGLVHDTLTELDVLTGDGRDRHAARRTTSTRDLFFGFPNSYGTLGYALRLTRTDDARCKPFVAISSTAASAMPEACFAALDARVPRRRRFRRRRRVRAAIDLVLTVGRFVDPRAVRQRLHVRAHLLPLDPRARERLPHRARLPVALGHRLVLVLEERRRAAAAGAPAATAASASIRVTYQKIMRWNSRGGVTRALDRAARRCTPSR